MRTGKQTILWAALILVLGLYRCGAEKDGDAADDGIGVDQPAEEQLPEVTIVQAEQALSDAMLISAQSLFLVFGAGDGATSVSNEDGSVRVAWDDSTDFNSGVGLYTVVLAGYAVAEDDPFGADYNGYILSGDVATGSSDGVSATMVMDLTMSHADAENFPVRTLELDMISADSESAQATTGTIRVNGHEMTIEDLAQAFQTGG